MLSILLFVEIKYVIVVENVYYVVDFVIVVVYCDESVVVMYVFCIGVGIVVWYVVCG